MNDSVSVAGDSGRAFGEQTFAQFQDELRRVARLITAAAPAKPLEAVLNAIQRNPALSQARLLTRILAAYAGQPVSFRSAEVAAFDREHLALLIALMDTHDAGSLPPADWARASVEADAARRDIGG